MGLRTARGGSIVPPFHIETTVMRFQKVAVDTLKAFKGSCG